MNCPKCHSENVYFDGAFFKCRFCKFQEWAKEDWEKIRARWGLCQINQHRNRLTRSKDSALALFWAIWKVIND